MTAIPNIFLTFAETQTYTAYFKRLDKDGDSFVTGAEIRPLFLKSQLPQPVLGQACAATALLSVAWTSGTYTVTSCAPLLCWQYEFLLTPPPPS
jgi:hypothetical protein